MSSKDLKSLEHCSQPPADLSDIFDTAVCEAASRSEQIIRWLPLLAANDVLDHADELHPVA